VIEGDDPAERAPSAPKADDAKGIPSPWKPLLTAAKAIVPSTLLVSLFFYFGLRYTSDHYQQYGLDDQGLGFSTTDYVVRSLNVTIQPARLVALAVIIAVVAHVAIVTALRVLEPRNACAAVKVARRLGYALVVLGAAGMFIFWSSGRFGTSPMAAAGWWMLSVLLLAYGAYLAWVRYGSDSHLSHHIGSALGKKEAAGLASVLLAVAVLLVAHGAFEFTRAYARERALQQALRNERLHWTFPLVRVYSKVDLALDELDVPEERLPGENGAYRYRYSELRLLLEHDEQLVLWPMHRSPRFGVFVLRESDDFRVEYTPELR
jgi:hypothetical protein